MNDKLNLQSLNIPEEKREELLRLFPEVRTEADILAEAGRDWWPISIRWATQGRVPAQPAVVARPTSTAQVAAVLEACNEAHVPVTVAAGRSGVCGASVPVFGGVALDMTSMSGVVDIDQTSLVAEALAGTFGPDLEEALQKDGCTLGHWPQSMALSTVGGWLACRGAGQYSTRYGKVEDMVSGLEVTLADGRVIRTGGRAPRSATGPDLTQLFVGSEGTLGVVTSAVLRLHPVPPAAARRAFGFPTFQAGLDACRRIVQDGATPAVLRLYDRVETERHFGIEGTCAMVVHDESDQGIVEATMGVVDRECASTGGGRLEDGVVDQWFARRNDVSALAPLYRSGAVVDTIEIAARWSALPRIYDECVSGLMAVPGSAAASAHQSHAYTDGACLYFTFGGIAPHGDNSDDAWAEEYYMTAWETVMKAVSSAGGTISHHHGIGLHRGRYLAASLGGAFDVLVSLKQTLDPRGILNPGKLGLPSPFGEPAWPPAAATRD